MKNHLSYSGKLGILAVIIALALPMGSYAQETHVVNVTNNVFTPKNITINAGDIVQWNCTQGNHNVNGQKTTYPNNPKSFGNNVGNNWTYSYTFADNGKYDYRCDPHFGLGMTGTVTVMEPEASQLKVSFIGMNPHVGQMFSLYLKDLATGEYIDSAMLTAIPGPDFDIELNSVWPGSSYNVDFFSDHNGNGSYDSPPVDHAWRLELNNLAGDTTVTFAHNTNFTDIFPGSTGINALEIAANVKVWPNPFTDEINIQINGFEGKKSIVTIMNLTGQEIYMEKVEKDRELLDLDLGDYSPGIYFLSVTNEARRDVIKLMKK